MLTQVAQSKGTEWMVSNYNEWQKRSPLRNMPPKRTSFLNQLNGSLTQKEERPGRDYGSFVQIDFVNSRTNTID